MKEKEYFVDGKAVIFIKDVDIAGVAWVVCDADGYLELYRKSELKNYEDTYSYKRRTEIEKEIKELESKKDVLIRKIKKEAVESLMFTMKLNSAFSNDSKLSTVGLLMAKELEKLVDKKEIN